MAFYKPATSSHLWPDWLPSGTGSAAGLSKVWTLYILWLIQTNCWHDCTVPRFWVPHDWQSASTQWVTMHMWAFIQCTRATTHVLQFLIGHTGLEVGMTGLEITLSLTICKLSFSFLKVSLHSFTLPFLVKALGHPLSTHNIYTATRSWSDYLHS